MNEECSMISLCKRKQNPTTIRFFFNIDDMDGMLLPLTL